MGMLIFDLGMDNIKGTFIDEGEMITEKRDICLIRNGEYVEQDPEDWYVGIVEIINKIVKFKPDAKISSIAITYQPGTFVCVDKYGNHLLNAILPADNRAKYQIHICKKNIKRHGIREFIPWDEMILPKLLWIKYNKSDIYKKTFKVLTPDGYLAYRLTGETAVDEQSALLMGYDLEHSNYDARLLNRLEIDQSLFPCVRRTGECIGVISGEVKEELNLKYDVNLLLFSSCIITLSEIAQYRGNRTVIYDAESSILCFVDKDLKIKYENNLTKRTFKDRYIYYCSGNYEFYFLKWVKSILKIDQEDIKTFKAGSHGLMVLPYIMGYNKMHSHDLKGGIIGIGQNDSLDIMNATFEAIGYSIKERLEYITNLGAEIEYVEIYSTVKNKLFYQALSNILGKKIYSNYDYESFVNTIYCILSGKEINCKQYKEIFLPDEDLSAKYNQLYRLYKAACSYINEINRLSRKITKNI